jgi:DNA-binding NarL/FixJ family response regulator
VDSRVPDHVNTSILIVDDHTMFSQALTDTIQIEHDLTVVAQAHDSTSAVTLAQTHQPDVILMDIALPGDGIASRLTKITHVAPHAKTIIVTMHEDFTLIQQTLQLGITGYLVKTATRLELIGAIRAAHSPTTRVTLSVSPTTLTPQHHTTHAPLSHREHSVITLAAQGLSNRQIATRLTIAEGTVKRHLGNIFTKLNAVSRIDAINKAINQHLIPVTPR